MNIFRCLQNIFELHLDPIKYWKRRGTNIGERCEIHTGAILGSEPYLITIGDDVRINAGVQLLTHDGGVWVVRHLKKEFDDIDLFRKIRIGNNVHIGTNAVIMPGVTIGNNCIIGVGAIVTKSIPDNSIAVGIPAHVIETIDEYIKKNQKIFLHVKKLSADEKKEFVIGSMGD